MSHLEEAVERWPTSGASALPVRLESGRCFSGIRNDRIPEFVGDLFSGTEYHSIRLTISDAGSGFSDIKVEGCACPTVPYATLSGEQLGQFMDFVCVRDLTIWVHCNHWFWVANLEDEELEKLIDSFITSLHT
ncbi:hypothetical protein [Marinobacter sp.]|jgi:hypothetical protein|uniref:hypothetical protein n=1 Tax=Marinobacter sp. TaxID=50741 RepID=UPI002612689B|nr:hypothetical protein [Marinobacter sp.]